MTSRQVNNRGGCREGTGTTNDRKRVSDRTTGIEGALLKPKHSPPRSSVHRMKGGRGEGHYTTGQSGGGLHATVRNDSWKIAEACFHCFVDSAPCSFVAVRTVSRALVGPTWV